MLALMDAPDIVRKVVLSSSEWTLEEDKRKGSGRT